MKRCTWPATILRQTVVFKPQLIRIHADQEKGPKCAKKNLSQTSCPVGFHAVDTEFWPTICMPQPIQKIGVKNQIHQTTLWFFPIHQPDLVSLCLWLLLLADRTATQCGLLLVPISRKGRACCASQITHSKECTTHQQSPSEPAQTVHIWLVYWFASQYGSMFQYSAFIRKLIRANYLEIWCSFFHESNDNHTYRTSPFRVQLPPKGKGYGHRASYWRK